MMEAEKPNPDLLLQRSPLREKLIGARQNPGVSGGYSSSSGGMSSGACAAGPCDHAALGIVVNRSADDEAHSALGFFKVLMARDDPPEPPVPQDARTPEHGRPRSRSPFALRPL
jgi:hypothetical protein